MYKLYHKGLFTNDVSIFWGLWHPLVLMSAYHQLLAFPLVLQIDNVSPEPKTIIFGWSLKMPNQPSICPKRSPVEPSETHWGLFWMDSLELLDFSSFIIFSGDPWSLLVSFCQLFKLPLVVQCCDVICEWPLSLSPTNPKICIVTL